MADTGGFTRGSQALAGKGKATLPPRSALHPLKSSKRETPNKAGTIHLIGLPIKPDAKSARPQGTSPSGKGDDEQDKEIPIVNMTVADASSQAKSNPSASSDSECDGDSEEGSINKEIASAWKFFSVRPIPLTNRQSPLQPAAHGLECQRRGRSWIKGMSLPIWTRRGLPNLPRV